MNRTNYLEDLFSNSEHLYKNTTVAILSRRYYIVSTGIYPRRELFTLRYNFEAERWQFYAVNHNLTPDILKKKLKRILRCDTMLVILKRQNINVHEIIANCIHRTGYHRKEDIHHV